ncbi:hypothetical protein BV25DRAFT_1886708 [Artomyces pyxidatus]|uniref:Uncharacterized protein n=1 Tax=Artomyces pyxidatus TaxID=48021 RepID=A0ACB8T009_9AGAM|nr:hypothetical protein BV25DRAFT_1886708 [Artomyces pyxidatus]
MSRRRDVQNNLPTPTSSPVRSRGASSLPQQAAQSSRQPEPRKFVSVLNEYLSSHYPAFKRMTEEEIKAMLIREGATEETLWSALEEHNAAINHLLKNHGSLALMGALPTDDDRSVSYIPIPQSPYAFRFWDGGVEDIGQFFVDFFHIRQRVPVSTPPGYEIYPIAAPGDYQLGDKLMSWDVAMGYDPRVTGVAEKFSVPEGSRMRLIRPGHEDFFFIAPVRQSQFNFAQAVSFLPVG